MTVKLLVAVYTVALLALVALLLISKLEDEDSTLPCILYVTALAVAGLSKNIIEIFLSIAFESEPVPAAATGVLLTTVSEFPISVLPRRNLKPNLEPPLSAEALIIMYKRNLLDEAVGVIEILKAFVPSVISVKVVPAKD
tara:strand:- start:57 stop:476 length:420 start_codon:yes stop_codon:yes gene_type:complete